MFKGVRRSAVWHFVIPAGQHGNKFQTRHFGLLVVSCWVHSRLQAQLGPFCYIPSLSAGSLESFFMPMQTKKKHMFILKLYLHFYKLADI